RLLATTPRSALASCKSRGRCRGSRRSRPAARSTRAARSASSRAIGSGPSCSRPAPTVPRAGSMANAADNTPLLRLSEVSKDFDVSRPWLNRVLEGTPQQLLRAVDGMSFELRRGETLALVGESGCGKSTVARLIVGLYAPTQGRIEFDGIDLGSPGAAALRRRMQMIFQDPYASLNPRWRVMDIVAEPIRVLGLAKSPAEIGERVAELLVQVGLAREDKEKYS